MNGRALGYKANLAADQVNGANCTASCKGAGFVLAGTEYSGECCKSLPMGKSGIT